MPTNLPKSEQSGNLDNISVTRAEFREQIGVLLEYLAQTLGNVSGTYTAEVVEPEKPILSGEPTIDLDAVPATEDSTTRIPSTSWVKRSGRYVGSTAPNIPLDGMLWVDNSTQPYQLKVYDDGTNDWDLLSGFPSGTIMLFRQSSAPLGWTKLTSQDNKALRVVAGSVSTGGNLAFTSAFSNRSMGTPTTRLNCAIISSLVTVIVPASLTRSRLHAASIKSMLLSGFLRS